MIFTFELLNLREKMIIVTGASGFIGSCLVQRLNELGIDDIVVVDEFETPAKLPNLEGKKIREKVHRGQLFNWLVYNHDTIDVFFHLGARTDTTEQDRLIFDQLNVNYSKRVWEYCTEHQIPLVYASSAATYGLGEYGYDDSHDVVSKLQPLNPYGRSKNDFDAWALKQTKTPARWHGLKFFNVYGPNEYHKARMASVVFHTARKVKEQGHMQLFRSHREGIADGRQSRDFIYVKDIVHICIWLWQTQTANGLYNAGTGQARTFLDLANATFAALGKEPVVSFIDTPEDIRETYQYFTQANMQKLLQAGYNTPFYSLEAGITDYVQSYLHSELVW